MKRTDVRGLLRLSPAAIVMGVGCALVLIAASVVAARLEDLLWTDLPDALSVDTDGPWWILAVLTATGLLVGLVVWKWPGGAGSDPATTGLVAAPLPPSAVPGLLITVILALAGGVSLGPENPIVAVNVALVFFFGMRLMPGAGGLTWVGIAAAGTIGAMFGTPVAAALILTEMAMGDKDEPLWDRLFGPLLAAGAGSLTIQLLEQPEFTVGVGAYPGLHALDLLSGPAVALVAAALGLLLALAFPYVHKAFHSLRNPVLILTAGGVVLGLLGMWGGKITMFKGLDEMKELADDPTAYTVGALAVIVVVKLLAFLVAASSAFRGGHIFPVVFAGVALGLMVTAAFPDVPAALSVGCGILGLTMAVTRQGWLSIFMAATIVGDIALLPLLCLAVLPVWLLLANAPELEIHEPSPAAALRPDSPVRPRRALVVGQTVPMTTYRYQPGNPQPEDVPVASRVNGGRLWSGGVAAAVIAAGLAIVGFLVVKGLLKLPILGVDVEGGTVQPGMFTYALIAALAALLATGIMHLLLLGTPRPFLFFGWIVALGTMIAMLVPLLVVDRLATGAATAVVNLVIGIAIGVLVGGSAKASLRVPMAADPADPFAPRPGM